MSSDYLTCNLFYVYDQLKKKCVFSGCLQFLSDNTKIKDLNNLKQSDSFYFINSVIINQ